PGGGGRGDRVGEDRRLPGGLPLLLPVGPVRLTGPAGLARHRRTGRRGEGDRRHRGDRVLHRGGGTRSRRAADVPGRRGGPAGRPRLAAADALRTIAAFRLALPRTVLRYAGGRELTLGDLGTEAGMLGGINAIIVGNYLTTLGRPAQADLEMLGRLRMPIKALSGTL